MTLASLLFRRQPAPAADTAQPKALDQMVKPWPLAAATNNTRSDEGEDTWISAEPRSAVVRERLAQFIARR